MWVEPLGVAYRLIPATDDIVLCNLVMVNIVEMFDMPRPSSPT